MANVKLSALPPLGSPATNDYLITEDVSGPTDAKVLISDIITLVFNNIPSTNLQVLGSNTLTVAGNTLSIASFTAMSFLYLGIYTTSTGGTTDLSMRFNNDSAANYAYRLSSNGATDGAASVSQGAILISVATSDILFATAQISNMSADEKLVYMQRVNRGTAGAGNAPGRAEFAGKWANTAAQISRVDVINVAGTGNFNVGSTLIVMGHN